MRMRRQKDIARYLRQKPTSTWQHIVRFTNNRNLVKKDFNRVTVFCLVLKLSRLGQMSVEYFVILAAVAGVTLLAASPFLQQTRQTVQGVVIQARNSLGGADGDNLQATYDECYNTCYQDCSAYGNPHPFFSCSIYCTAKCQGNF